MKPVHVFLQVLKMLEMNAKGSMLVLSKGKRKKKKKKKKNTDEDGLEERSDGEDEGMYP